MKCSLLSGMLAAALGASALAQPEPLFDNTQVIIAPPNPLPQIDTISFANYATLIVNFTNGVIPANVVPPPFVQLPFETQDTLNYTNTAIGYMSCNLGFIFDTYVPGVAVSNQRRRAANFFNAGTIDSGTLGTSNYLADLGEPNIQGTNFIILGNPATVTTINASNISNPGILNMGFESVLSIQGGNVDLSRGTLFAEAGATNFANEAFTGNFSSFNNGTIFDGAWGNGDPASQALLNYPNGVPAAAEYTGPQPFTPSYDIVFRGQFQVPNPTSLFFTNNPSGYQADSGPLNASGGGFVRFIQSVWINPGTNALADNNLGVNVYLAESGVGYQAVVEFTNLSGTAPDNLYVVDTFNAAEPGNVIYAPLGGTGPFGFFAPANFGLILDGFVGATPTYVPANYYTRFGGIFLAATNYIIPTFYPGTPPTPPVPPGTQLPLFGNGLGGGGLVTNEYAAYRGLISPSSVLLGGTFGQDVTNTPGRIEISADDYLNLALARITSVNYVKLNATNQFAGSPGAQISAPFFDLDLRSTNALLTISNLIPASIARPLGYCDLYSARWTNVVTNLIVNAPCTNSFAVLMVDVHFLPATPPVVRNLILRSTNLLGGPDAVLVSDPLNVSNTFLIDTTALTVGTTNYLASPTNGSINILTLDVLWPSALPRLQYLTNYGAISSVNEIVFGGAQTSIYGSASTNQAYTAFVNAGGITNYGTQIGAQYFQNSGVFDDPGGSFDLQIAQTAVLAPSTNFQSATNVGIYAPLGNITLDATSLYISNHVLRAGGALTLGVPYYLDDGSYESGSAFGVTNKNFWSIMNGISLPILPTYASLLATTITNTSPSFSPIVANTWAGVDTGPVPAGFSGNAALGHLILDGLDTNSLFSFSGVAGGASNALYVDCLELADLATNLDNHGNPLQVTINPGMRIYYAQALVANGVSIAEKLSGHAGSLDTNGGQFIWVSNYNCGFFSSTNIVTNQGVTNRVNTALATSQDLGTDTNASLTPCPNPPSAVVPPPVVSLTSPLPAPGTQYTGPTNLALAATVASGIPITLVQFYANNTLLGSAATAPYTFVWTNAQPGTYNVSAQAIWNSGNTAGTVLATMSPMVIVTVLGQPVVTNLVPSLLPPPSDTNFGVGGFAKGTYHGLFYDTNAGVNAASAGYFAAATTVHGVISGKILLGSHAYTFSDRFNGNSVTGIARQGRKSLGFSLQMSPDLEQLQGTVSSASGWTASLQADLQAPGTSAAAYAGRYTIDFPGMSDVVGDGLGSVVLGVGGKVAFSGSLADGSKATESSAVSQAGYWPFYAPLYGGNGAIIGWLQFANGGLDGQLIWVKPAGVMPKYYPAGFTNVIDAAGFRYAAPPAGVRAIDFPAGLGNVVFSGGGLGGPVTNAVQVGVHNGVKDLSRTNKLLMTIDAANGQFSGSAVLPGIGLRAPFYGVILGGTNGAGYFLNRNAGLGGEVDLVP